MSSAYGLFVIVSGRHVRSDPLKASQKQDLQRYAKFKAPRPYGYAAAIKEPLE